MMDLLEQFARLWFESLGNLPVGLDKSVDDVVE